MNGLAAHVTKETEQHMHFNSMLHFVTALSRLKLSKMPFSLEKAVAGKREGDAVSQRNGKVPKVSEMKPEAPRQTSARTSTTNAPVNIVVYQITENAGDLCLCLINCVSLTAH